MNILVLLLVDSQKVSNATEEILVVLEELLFSRCRLVLHRVTPFAFVFMA